MLDESKLIKFQLGNKIFQVILQSVHTRAQIEMVLREHALLDKDIPFRLTDNRQVKVRPEYDSLDPEITYKMTIKEPRASKQREKSKENL